ncbi:(2Fe-2S)-binding protein [Myxococcota bacterium]|nr:(2Fe-2S)-binding protein [Myxococcota bacterium]
MSTKPAEGLQAVSVTVNGEEYTALAEPRMLLSDFLRHECGLTGTHVGCEQGVCGACTVRVDGSIVRSCLTFAISVAGSKIDTVEGMANADELHPVQAAFQEEHGLQCGFCTPGFLLTVQDLLQKIPSPTDQEIREHLSGNVCRCTGYQGIMAAVRSAAQKMQS